MGAVPGRFVVVGCTAEQGERWINEIETQRDVASAIMEAVKTLNWLPPYITGSANALLYTTVSINQSILNDIQSCNGRVMVLNTISYIDNAAHPAVMDGSLPAFRSPTTLLKLFLELINGKKMDCIMKKIKEHIYCCLYAS